MSETNTSGFEDVKRIREILFGEQAKQIVERIDLLEQQISNLRRENSLLRQLLEEEVSARESSMQQANASNSQQSSTLRRELFQNLQSIQSELTQSLEGKDRARQSEILNLQTALVSEAEVRHRENVSLAEKLIVAEKALTAALQNENATRNQATSNLQAALLQEHRNRAEVLGALQAAINLYASQMAGGTLASGLSLPASPEAVEESIS